VWKKTRTKIPAAGSPAEFDLGALYPSRKSRLLRGISRAFSLRYRSGDRVDVNAGIRQYMLRSVRKSCKKIVSQGNT